MSGFYYEDAQERIVQMLEACEALRDEVRGSDSSLVYLKLSTIETGLRLLGHYLAESRDEDATV